MKMLKGSISIMKERNSDGRFNKALEEETNLLKNCIEEYRQ